MNERFVHVIYCDDVRHEEGNKLTYVGCYQGEMFLSPIPGALPKFCAVVYVVTPYKKPFQKLEIRLLVDFEVLVELIVPSEQLVVDKGSEAEDGGEPFSRRQVTAILVGSPLLVSKPCKLRVLIVTEEGEIKGPVLRIKEPPPALSAPRLGPPPDS